MIKKLFHTAPGSVIERLLAFFWYGIVTSLYLGLLSFIDDAFTKVKKFDYNALPNRSDQTVILTGGTRGIGLEVLKKLLRLDYHVIIGVRNLSMGENIISDIRKSGIKSGIVKCFQLDLKSLTSVRKFAQNVVRETDRIDLLINNAGIMFEPYSLTEDGYETQFQVNHLSHYLLTQLLLPQLKSTGNSLRNTNCRIVNVSSLGHFGSNADVTDMANPKIYSAFRAYYDSKLCQILFTKYLDAQLKSEGANVSVFALHPGVIITDLYNNLSIIGRFCQMFKMFFRSTDDGSEIIMYTAISPDLEGKGGSYIANTEIKSAKKAAEDLALQQYLWRLSQDCINK